jgi:N-acetylglutamate synthase-like GNAT family acetyltransferase
MLSSRPIRADNPALAKALTEARLPTDDLGEAGRSFFRIELSGQLLGYGGFELYGRDALLRSIVVPAANRGQGHGRAVAEAMLREIRNAGGRQVYLLTTTASGFFEHLGFVRIDRADAPASILTTRQAASICASADLLAKAI